MHRQLLTSKTRHQKEIQLIRSFLHRNTQTSPDTPKISKPQIETKYIKSAKRKKNWILHNIVLTGKNLKCSKLGMKESYYAPCDGAASFF